VGSRPTLSYRLAAVGGRVCVFSEKLKKVIETVYELKKLASKQYFVFDHEIKNARHYQKAQPHAVIVLILIWAFIFLVDLVRVNLHFLDPFNNGRKPFSWNRKISFTMPIFATWNCGRNNPKICCIKNCLQLSLHGRD